MSRRTSSLILVSPLKHQTQCSSHVTLLVFLGLQTLLKPNTIQLLEILIFSKHQAMILIVVLYMLCTVYLSVTFFHHKTQWRAYVPNALVKHVFNNSNGFVRNVTERRTMNINKQRDGVRVCVWEHRPSEVPRVMFLASLTL